jgi:hypothetical protein
MIEEKKRRGRPKGSVGSGKYGEPTICMRIPLRLVEKVKKLLAKEVRK